MCFGGGCGKLCGTCESEDSPVFTRIFTRLEFTAYARETDAHACRVGVGDRGQGTAGEGRVLGEKRDTQLLVF